MAAVGVKSLRSLAARWRLAGEPAPGHRGPAPGAPTKKRLGTIIERSRRAQRAPELALVCRQVRIVSACQLCLEEHLQQLKSQDDENGESQVLVFVFKSGFYCSPT